MGLWSTEALFQYSHAGSPFGITEPQKDGLQESPLGGSSSPAMASPAENTEPCLPQAGVWQQAPGVPEVRPRPPLSQARPLARH